MLDKEGEKEECRGGGGIRGRVYTSKGGGEYRGGGWGEGAERRAVRRGTELERSRNVIISVVNLTHSMEWVPTTTTTTTTMI